MVSNLTVKIGADIAGLQKELQKATGNLDSFSKGMTKIGGMIAGAFAVNKLVDFGAEVFAVTAEFQKFEAVLTNTLGHSGAAKAALSQITEFAAKTPFQVNELTASFVKLANQGFIPTLDQMRKLGDLAASQGKSFDQLTEAIIDAQTGEFERLKEFGIRASKEGDRVTFTFKGVKKQVDFTSDAMRAYVLSLGDVAGVTGGMDAQSKTLGGGLSNLKDSWEQLTLAIGRSAEKGGLFSGVLDLISDGVKGLTNFIDTASVEEQVDLLLKIKDARIAAATAGDIEEWGRLNSIIQQGTESVREWYEGQKKLTELQSQHAKVTTEQAQAIQQLKTATTTDSVAGKNSNPTGDGFLFDIGAINNAQEQLNTSLSKIDAGLINSKQSIETWAEAMRISADEVAKKMRDVGPIIANAISGIADSIGNALAGTGDFGKDLIEAVAGFAKQLGALFIATGVAEAAFQSGNPYAMIAAGVALVALGSAVSGMMQKQSAGSKAMASGGAGPGKTPSEAYININGRISGYSLELVGEKEAYRRGRVG